jgi:hypothetical protein
MASNHLTAYIIIFNVIMAVLLFASSQYVLSVIEARGEVIGEIGIYIDTHYSGPIQYTPPTIRNALPNFPLFIFILTLIGNAILIFQLNRENKQLRSKIVL